MLHRLVMPVVLLCLLVACSEPEPLRIGFLGGLSGRVADLGLNGRNGALLAIEECNAAGGINGHRLELLLADDRQDPQTARQQLQKLIDQRVAVVIGPMTSSIATAIVPLSNDNRLPLISPTVTTEELTGIDDYFFRVTAGTSHYSKALARYLLEKKGIKRVNVIYDLNNKAYTESWLNGFRAEFEQHGGSLDKLVSFHSGPDVHFSQLASNLLHPSSEAILILSSAMDSAMLSQQLHKQGYRKALVASAWSATEKLIEMGGNTVEGMLLAQFFDREDHSKSYLVFKNRYQQRFLEEPGFASVGAYDATTLALQALKANGGSVSKQAILDQSGIDGVQGKIILDGFGDAQRPTYITTVKNGKFIIMD